MSWEQIGNEIVFSAFYVESKIGKTGLTVTVDVYRNGTQIVTGGSAVEVGGGLYTYALASGSVTVAGEYLAVFKTATATVDQQHIPSAWLVGRAGVENLDQSVNAVNNNAINAYNAAVAALNSLLNTVEPALAALPTAASVADAVWDEASADHVAAGSTGQKLSQIATAAAIADAVWDEASADHVAAGSTGQKLSQIGAATVTITAPVAADGATLSLVRGDDYAFAQSRHLTFTSASWPNLTGATEIRMTVRRRKEAFGTGADPVWFTTTDRAASRVFGVGSQTVVFELTDTNTLTMTPETAAGKYDIQATLGTGEIITLVSGVVNVTEDQTRP